MSDELVHFIVNPQSRGGSTGKKWDKMLKTINSLLKFKFEVAIADGIGEGVVATKEAIDTGATILVPVGGEGTINEVVNGMYQKNNEKLRLGFIRAGTVNDYQQVINWPSDLETQLEAINRNQTRKTPLTLVKADVDRVALNIADVGIGANIAYASSVERRLKWIKGEFRYTLLALRAVKNWKNIPARVTVDDREIEGNLSMLMTGFSSQAGGYKVLPQAETFGSKLAYLTAMDFGKVKMIRMMSILKKGTHDETIQGVYMGHTSELKITAEAPLLFEVDGEPFSYNSTTIVVKAIPKAINVIMSTT
ncbi:MAG: hypothetical protein IH840_04140 [Candidatus Heimdallarchaeota archaeon]|nr:hypothetical protein [Candidatus Heimdallarchaeota archaeon]